MFSDNSDLIKDKDINVYDFRLLNECAMREYIEQCITNEINDMLLKQLMSSFYEKSEKLSENTQENDIESKTTNKDENAQ